MRKSNEHQSQSRVKSILTYVLSLLILAGWICVLNWLAVRYGGASSYAKWYLTNGTLISASTAFLALVWTKLGQRDELLSMDPLLFLAACLVTAAQFFLALEANLSGPLDGTKRSTRSVFIPGVVWDGVFAILIDLLIALTVLAWLVVVAPGFYILTLFTGAPGRRELRGTGQSIVVKRAGSLTTLTSQPSSFSFQSDAVDISFRTQPFVLTNAINAIVIFLADKLLARMG
jgi:hypothetical protein